MQGLRSRSLYSHCDDMSSCFWLQVHHINANFFLDQTAMKPEEEGATFSFSSGFEDPSTSTYISFLKEGLEKAKEYLAQ